MSLIEHLGQAAKVASRDLATLGTAQKNAVLRQLADDLLADSSAILTANQKDLEQATANGISAVMVDRLRLDDARLAAMATGLRDVAALPDPIGEVVRGYTNMDGLQILQKRVPLGVIGMIFESRPNVMVDAFSLAFKTSNAIILRGGKDAIHSNKALVHSLRQSLEAQGLNPDVVQLVEDTSHAVAEELMQATAYLDVLIPRGGAGLINRVKQLAKVPVIETGVGNVHIYVDAFADLEMAIKIVTNAKIQRPSVCNAAESVVVHGAIAEQFLPALEAHLATVQPVEFRADERAAVLLSQSVPATASDYATEFLDYILSVKVVDSCQEAIDWINHYSSHHSEAIVTQNLTHAQLFQEQVDAAAVYVNASTRFTDGFVFGLGAEIGISTQKMHARGPMGLEALTSTKYLINGQGQVRE